MSNGRRHITPTSRIGRHIAAVAVTLIALAACHNPSPSGRLGGVDTLVNARPDSVLTLLNGMARDTAKMSRRDLMRYYLLRTNAENKCDTVLTARHAALMRRVCDYYDRHSSKREANNRMLAHYLLGRCYDDMGEAPLALEEFHNAENAADTTDIQLDYKVLARIHGQASNLFLQVEDYDDAIQENKAVRRCAILASDTLMFISAHEMLASIYEAKGETDTALVIRDQAIDLYERAGMHNRAARCTGSSIDNLVERGELEKAGRYIHEYETASGVFDANGEIMHGLEVYYYSKGLYLLRNGHLAAAESLFRKELMLSERYSQRQAGYKGLRELFQILGKSDSVAKYAILELQMCDSANIQHSAESYQHMQSLYKYERMRQRAYSAERKKHATEIRLLYYALLTAILLFALFVSIYVLYRRRRKYHLLEKALLRKQEQLFRAKNELEDLLALKEHEAEIMSKQMEGLKTGYNKLNQMEQDKIQEIKDLKSQLSTTQSEMSRIKKSTNTITLRQSEIVVSFRKHVEQNTKPSLDEWRAMQAYLMQANPAFIPELYARYTTIKENEVDLCILVRLGFEVYEISALTGMTSTNVSVMRRRLLNKIFGLEGGGAKEFDRLINEM